MFGRKKMYKKGMQDAMSAYEKFGEKQEQALSHIREEISNGNKKMEDMITLFGEDLNNMYDYLTSKEKAALYNLCTPMDIANLEDEEKSLLVAILYQLASDEGVMGLNDYQRKYIRSIQKYLNVTNPQTSIDLSVVENIDSIDTQKSVLQVVLEFLYLQDGDELSDDQEEFLGYFSLNKRQAQAVELNVSKIYNTVGAEGVCEKYGFVEENEEVVSVPEGNDSSVNDEPETEATPDLTAEEIDSKYDFLDKYEVMKQPRKGGGHVTSLTNSIDTKDYIITYERDPEDNLFTGKWICINKNTYEEKLLFPEKINDESRVMGLVSVKINQNLLLIERFGDDYYLVNLDKMIIKDIHLKENCLWFDDKYVVYSVSGGMEAYDYINDDYIVYRFEDTDRDKSAVIYGEYMIFTSYDRVYVFDLSTGKRLPEMEFENTDRTLHGGEFVVAFDKLYYFHSRGLFRVNIDKKRIREITSFEASISKKISGTGKFVFFDGRDGWIRVYNFKEDEMRVVSNDSYKEVSYHDGIFTKRSYKHASEFSIVGPYVYMLQDFESPAIRVNLTDMSGKEV